MTKTVEVVDEQLPDTEISARPAPSNTATRWPRWVERHQLGLVACALGLVGSVVGFWHITVPSLWLDEATTLSAASWTPSQILLDARHNEAAHAVYYFFIHFITGGHPTLLEVRSISAVAFGVAVALLVWLGKLVGGTSGLRVGGFSGLMLVVLPMASRYGQEARSYEIVMMLALLATCFFVKTLQSTERRWRLLYIVAMALVIYVNFLSILLIAAQATTILLLNRERKALLKWVASWLAVALLIAPVAVESYGQRSVIDWHTKPTLDGLANIFVQFGGTRWGLGLLAVVIVTAVAIWSPRKEVSSSLPVPIALATPWLFLPPILLYLISLHNPSLTGRYVIGSLPALALLAGVALARIPLWTAAVAITLFVVVTFSVQQSIRSPLGHDEDLRGVTSLIHGQEHRGDGIVFFPGYAGVVLYAQEPEFTQIRQLAISQSAANAGYYSGIGVGVAGLPMAMLPYQRIWRVSIAGSIPTVPYDKDELALLEENYTVTESHTFTAHPGFHTFVVTLYTKKP